LKRNLPMFAILAGIVVLLVTFVSPQYRQGEPSPAGRTARDFTFTFDGKPAHLSELRGRVVVLNFWATWCPPCVEETPALNHLQEHIASKGGVVLGISADDDQAAYDNFLREYDVQFPTYRDASKSISASYGTFVFPETYVIDREGRITRKIIGSQEWDSPTMLSYVDGLLPARP
jgi:cytochrome c biogenesis protein CcmG, thiol:disulfide interchange protein DsbE